MSKPFRVVGLDHVNVTTPVELLEDVVEFYRDCLGLDLIPKPDNLRPGGAWFTAGNQQIHVSVDDHNPPQTAHFALRVTDFQSIVQCVREAGCHIEQAREIPGRRRFFTRDPAGNRVEIFTEEQS